MRQKTSTCWRKKVITVILVMMFTHTTAGASMKCSSVVYAFVKLGLKAFLIGISLLVVVTIMVSYVAFAMFSISDSGKTFFEEDSSRTVMLPILSEVNEGKSSMSQSIPRRGNGCHALATFLRFF